MQVQYVTNEQGQRTGVLLDVVAYQRLISRKPTDPDLLTEMSRAELEAFGYEYSASGVKYSAPEGLHDDCVMALALAVFGRDQFGEMPDLTPKPFVEGRHPGIDPERKVRRKPWEPAEPVHEPKWTPSKEMVRL